jgi:hypothetical protein
MFTNYNDVIVRDKVIRVKEILNVSYFIKNVEQIKNVKKRVFYKKIKNVKNVFYIYDTRSINHKPPLFGAITITFRLSLVLSFQK